MVRSLFWNVANHNNLFVRSKTKFKFCKDVYLLVYFNKLKVNFFQAYYVETCMFNVFKKEGLAQIFFIWGVRRIANTLLVKPFEKGPCFSLSNTYIKMCSRGKRESFFQLIHTISYAEPKNLKNPETIKKFLNKLNKFQVSLSIFLDDRPCLDAFCFMTCNGLELREKLNRVLNQMQQTKDSCYTHFTFGHIHSCVLEQKIENGVFTYAIYDPNKNERPIFYSTCDALAQEIEGAIKKLQLTDLKLKYFFAKNSKLLLTFYIYGKKTDILHDLLVENLQTQIKTKRTEYFKAYLNYSFIVAHEKNFLINEVLQLSPSSHYFYVILELENKPGTYGLLFIDCVNKQNELISFLTAEQVDQLGHFLNQAYFWKNCFEKPILLAEKINEKQLSEILKILNSEFEPKNHEVLELFDEALEMINRYLSFELPRGILLNNLFFIVKELEKKSSVCFQNTLSEIQDALKSHLLTSDFFHSEILAKKLQCYEYFKANVGNINLLDEAARLGDLQAISTLVSYFEPLPLIPHSISPLEKATWEAHYRAVKIMISFYEKKSHFNSDVYHKLINHLNWLKNQDTVKACVKHEIKKLLDFLIIKKMESTVSSSFSLKPTQS